MKRVMSKKIAIALLCAGTALLAGCNKKTPSGQVAATVNGEEITLQEINTELQSAQLPPNADKAAVQKALLQRVIDRKLLVSAAEDKKLDKTPEYMGQKRRMDELLLAQTFAKQQLTSVPVPTPGEVDKFMNDRPNVYKTREAWLLDQIRFPAPKNAQALAPLAQDHTMDAVAARLKTLGIQFERGNAQLDTGNLPKNVLDQVNKLPATEPFVIPQAGVVTVNIVTQRKAIPIDAAAAKQAATRDWRQQKFADMLQKQLDALKAGAKITYQSGFGPPPATPTQPAIPGGGTAAEAATKG